MIFDVDGTLVDSNDAHTRAWREAFAEHGITAAYDQVRRAIGMGGDKLMPLVSGIEEESAQGKKIAQRRTEIFKNRWLRDLQPFPHTRDLVQRLLDDGFTLAVASSASDEELQPLLEAANVADLIPTRASSDDADRSKPDPDIVRAAVKRVKCPPDRCVMIGDTPYDIEAALRADIQIIAFTCGGWRREDLSAAAAVYADPADLLLRYDGSILAALGLRERSSA